MVALLLVAGIFIVFLIFIYPQVGLGLLVFSGRYSLERFTDYLGWGDSLAGLIPLRIAPLILALLLLALVARFATGKRIIRPSSRSIACLLLALGFGLILLTGCTYSPAESYGLEKALEYMGITLFIFALPFVLLDNLKSYRLFLIILLLIPLMLGLLGILGTLVGGTDTSIRISAMGGGPIVFGRFMAIGVFMCLTFLASTKRMWYKLWLIAALILLTAACFASGSRGVMIALAVSLILFIAATIFAGAWGRQVTRSAFIAFTAVVIIGVVLLNLFPQVFSSHLIRYQYLWEEIPGSGSVAWRLYSFDSALAMFTQRPFLGYGTGAFAPVALGVQSGYPHNIFLEIAAELGILGLALFGCFILLILRSTAYLFKTAKDNAQLGLYSIATATCFIFYLVAAQFSGDLFDSRFIWLFGGMTLVLESITIRDKRARQNSIIIDGRPK